MQTSPSSRVTRTLELLCLFGFTRDRGMIARQKCDARPLLAHQTQKEGGFGRLAEPSTGVAGREPH